MLEALAVLRLNNDPIQLDGAITREDSFPYPVRYMKLPSAYVDNVTKGDRSVRTTTFAARGSSSAKGRGASSRPAGSRASSRTA